MGDLEGRDERLLFELVSEWDGMSPMSASEVRRLIADGMLRLVPSDAALVSYRENGQFGTVSTDPAIAAWRLAQADEWYRQRHPVIEHWVRTRDDRAVRLSDVIGAAALHRLELYQAFWRPFSVERTLGVRTRPAVGGAPIDLACYRTGRDFSLRDVEVIERVSSVAARMLTQAAMRPLVMPLLGALPLTVREAEVLAWATLGHTNARIATRLVVSELTVKKHMENVLRKLGVRNRIEAAALARTTWARASVEPPSPSRSELRSALTARQREVLSTAAAGRSRRSIADELGIAPGTVKRHLEDAYRRLGVEGRAPAFAALGARID